MTDELLIAEMQKRRSILRHQLKHAQYQLSKGQYSSLKDICEKCRHLKREINKLTYKMESYKRAQKTH